MPNIPDRESIVHMQTARRVPITLVKGLGTKVWDDEGNEYHLIVWVTQIIS